MYGSETNQSNRVMRIKKSALKKRSYWLVIFVHALLGLWSQEVTVPKESGVITEGRALETRAVNVFYTDRDSAIYYFKLAKELYGREKAWDLYIGCLNSEIAVYFYDNRYGSLDSAMQVAKEISTTHLSPDTSRAYTGFLSNSGVINDMIGKYDQAAYYYQEAMRLYNIRKDTNNLCIVYSNFADMYLNLGDTEEAQRYYWKSLQLQNNHSHAQPIRAKRHNDYGKALLAAGKVETALGYYEKGLAIYEKSDWSDRQYFQHVHQYLLQGLAKIWLQKGDLKKAEHYIQRAIQLLDKANITIDNYISYELLGTIEKQQGNYHESLVAYEKALHISEGLFKEYKKHPDISNGYLNLGELSMEMKNYEKAIEYFQTGLMHLSSDSRSQDKFQNPSPDSYILNITAVKLLNSKGEAMVHLYREKRDVIILQAAFETFADAVALFHLARNDYYSTDGKLQLVESVMPVFERCISTAVDLYQATDEKKYLQDAFHLVEQNKAVVFLESIIEQEALGFSGVPTTIRKKENQLRSEINLLRQKLAIENQKDENDRNQSQLTVWSDQVFMKIEAYKNLQKELENKYPNYSRIKKEIQFANTEQVQEKLQNSKSVILEYFVGQNDIYLFYVSKKELQVFKTGKTDDLFNSLQFVLEELHRPPNSNGEQFESFLEAANRLYKELLVPAKLKIPTDTERLIIVPDDKLSLLPFEIMVKNKEAQIPYLINDYSFSYSYSSTLFLKDNKIGKNKPKKNLVAFAPSFNELASSEERNCSGENLYSLRCSNQEVENINGFIPGDIYVGTDATKINFIEASIQSNIIHLATHACLENEHPMLNRIWFSDGFISNYELFNMQLNNDLAVLSACNTGSGKVLKGEGVQSLARGFLHAGCRSLITSLWSVDDCATSEIMSFIYEELDQGKEKDRALQLAKLRFVASADKLHRHPYFWGAFVQVGEVEPITVSAFFKSKILIGMAVLLCIAFLLVFKNRRLKNLI